MIDLQGWPFSRELAAQGTRNMGGRLGGGYNLGQPNPSSILLCPLPHYEPGMLQLAHESYCCGWLKGGVGYEISK